MCLGLFGDVLTCGLRGKGRMDWEVDLRYRKSYDSLESINFISFT